MKTVIKIYSFMNDSSVVYAAIAGEVREENGIET